MLTAAPPLPRLRVLRERLFIQIKNALLTATERSREDVGGASNPQPRFA